MQQNIEKIERILQQLEDLSIHINHIIIKVVIEKKLPLPLLIKAKRKQYEQVRQNVGELRDFLKKKICKVTKKLSNIKNQAKKKVIKASVKVPTRRKKGKSASLLATEKSSENKKKCKKLTKQKEELIINKNRTRRLGEPLGNKETDSCSNSVKSSNCMLC